MKMIRYSLENISELQRTRQYISYHVTYIKLTFDRLKLHQWENIMVH